MTRRWVARGVFLLAEGWVSSAAVPGAGRAQEMEAGTVFRDCYGGQGIHGPSACPEMVVVPAGAYMMGSPEEADELPIHRVTIRGPLAVGKYEVTFAEWDACVAHGGCYGYRPDDGGWGRGNRPVMKVDWNQVQTYVMWLSEKTGKAYRLLSEAEWEYVARAGSGTRKYSWGNEIGRNRANCDGCGSRWDDKQTAPVGMFAGNGFGLHDVHGNAWEWVQDCWNDSYVGAPADGSAWEQGDCGRRVVRGGSWSDVPRYLRSASRDGPPTGFRFDLVGFRVARSLTP